MAPRETENNTYAKFWGDKQRALWCVMVFSGVVNNGPTFCDMPRPRLWNAHKITPRLIDDSLYKTISFTLSGMGKVLI